MLPPPRTAPPPPVEARAPRTARWLDVVTTTVLGAVVLVVVAAAMPSLLRAGVSAAEEPQGLPPPVRGQHPTLVPRDHPRHALPFDDDPAPRGLDRPRALQNDPLAAPPVLPGHDREDDDEPWLGLRTGVTLKALPLRDRHKGTVVHEVKAGQAVSVLRDDGEWILVMYKGEGGLVTGWARRSETLLR